MRKILMGSQSRVDCSDWENYWGMNDSLVPLIPSISHTNAKSRFLIPNAFHTQTKRDNASFVHSDSSTRYKY
jgi:hypothetical protein